MDARWRTALVTGASSGIGRAIARQAAARGADVVVVARRKEELESLADEVAVHGRSCEVLPADLTDAEDLAMVERRVADPDRPVDLVVNNAGFGTIGRFWEMDVDREDTEVRLNVLALVRLSHAALASMVPRGRGGLLNVSSLAGFQPFPQNATYAATKAFVTSFTRSLHMEARGTGVHVTALCPGFTRTEFQARAGVEDQSSSMPDFMWDDADKVARVGLDGVTRDRPVAIPPGVTGLIGAGARLTPDAVITRVVSAFSRLL